jgi:hypothetical protein
MFSPLILVCSLMSGECNTLAAPVFGTEDDCKKATQAHIQTLTLPPQLVVLGWSCFEWDESA